MGKPQYKLSFTAASLAMNESISIAEVYLKCRDWDQTKQIIRENNLLQSRTNSRTVRVVRELIQRLGLLTNSQLELLVEGNPSEQKYLLWFAACKTYVFIREFAEEVLHEKYLSRRMILTDLDYDAFFNRKADWSEDLSQITTSTRKKIRQVLLLMVKEAGLMTDDNLIMRAMISNRLIEVLKQDIPMSYQFFPSDPF
jgi:hypothetical protein